MHSGRQPQPIGTTSALAGLPRRQLLQGAGALGFAAILRPTPVFSRPNRQLGPFSDWSEPINLGPVVNSGFNDFHPGISKDGLSLYFTSDRPGGVNGGQLPEIWVTQREDLDADWEPPLNLGPQINKPGFSTGVPNLTPNGLWLYFGSTRPGGCGVPAPSGNGDLWRARQEDPEDEDDFGWESPENLGCVINTPSDEDSPVYFRDRETGVTTLYFTRFDGPGGDFLNPDQDYNIYVSTLGDDGTFGLGVLVPELNSPFRDTRMAIRSDGLEMIITSNRPGGSGPTRLNLNLWVSTRASTLGRWSTPVNPGRPINYGGGYVDRGPALSFDGRTLYFASNRPGGSGKSDLWMATRSKLEGHD